MSLEKEKCHFVPNFWSYLILAMRSEFTELGNGLLAFYLSC